MAELVAAAVPELLRPEQAAQKYEEAVAVAVEKCAADTAGHTCYICMGPGDEEEGLVSGFCACRGGLGFAHVSCLARAAQVVAERWHTCRQCEQKYHGVVACALGWACWKTYVGRPETDWARILAMSVLGNGLFSANHDEDALSVQEAELAMKLRLGVSEASLLTAKANLANTYQLLGRREEASKMDRDIYCGRAKLNGEEHEETLQAASNYTNSLVNLKRFEEAKSVLRKTLPVARRALGENDETTLRMRWFYAEALREDPSATLDDLREAVTTLEETERIARRVFGAAHPTTVHIEGDLQNARAALRARETPSPPPGSA